MFLVLQILAGCSGDNTTERDYENLVPEEILIEEVDLEDIIRAAEIRYDLVANHRRLRSSTSRAPNHDLTEEQIAVLEERSKKRLSDFVEKTKIWYVQLQDGDLVYRYRTDDESWANLRGEEGYVIVRGGVQINKIVIDMN